MVQNALYLFVPHKAQVHPSLSTLLDFNCFLSFFSQSKPLYSSSLSHAPYTYTNADVRRDPLHPPHPTPCHTTSNTRICRYNTCAACVACGVWTVNGVSPYVGIRIGRIYRVELLVWRASDWLKSGKKQFKVKQSVRRQTRVYLGLYPA